LCIEVILKYDQKTDENDPKMTFNVWYQPAVSANRNVTAENIVEENDGSIISAKSGQ